MIRGVYAGASGLRAQQARIAAMANDLANSDTPGYKRDLGVIGAFPSLLLSRLSGGASAPVGKVGTGAGVTEMRLDLGQGSLTDSPRDLDLAIMGRGFFVVQTPQGTRYTRDGNLSRAPDGRLVNARGHRVQGADGDIVLPDGPVSVRADGALLVAGQEVGRLQVVSFPEAASLKKEGLSLVQAQGATPTDEAQVVQFSLERSNVDSVQLMVDLMVASRTYETNQRVLQIQDETLQRAVTEVGRV